MTAILEAIAAIIKWFLGDKQVAKREDDRRKQAAQDAVDAARAKDVDKVNAILHNKLCLTLIGIVALTSCTTLQPVYIAEQDKVFPVTIEGKAGWFVPDSVFKKWMQKIGGQ